MKVLPLLAVAAAAVATGCLFGGGDETISATRPGSIPTATAPANLPDPILLGESQTSGGTPLSGGSGESTYTVKSGDTLAGIAAQLGIPGSEQAAWLAEVLKLNGIQDPKLLRAGQEIRLPRATATPRPSGTGTPQPTATPRPTGTALATTPTSTAAATTATPRPTVVGGGGTYTVVSGDYPFLIAQKLGVPESQQAAWVQQLIALNSIDPSNLQVGQVLQLPAGTPSGASPTVTPTPTSTRTP